VTNIGKDKQLRSVSQAVLKPCPLSVDSNSFVTPALSGWDINLFETELECRKNNGVVITYVFKTSVAESFTDGSDQQ
jgi:hypothetical protein